MAEKRPTTEDIARIGRALDNSTFRAIRDERTVRDVGRIVHRYDAHRQVPR